VGQPSRRGHGDVRHLALRRSRRHGKRVDEARGIYRGEVLAIMVHSPTSWPTPKTFLPFSDGTVMTVANRKKPTPEEIRARREAHQARLRELNRHIERIKAELAAKQKSA
jgi:hypothetical protein